MTLNVEGAPVEMASKKEGMEEVDEGLGPSPWIFLGDQLRKKEISKV